MDYKAVSDVIGWHARFSEINGVTARVLMLLATEQSYKTGFFSGSLMDIAEALDVSKQSVAGAIKKLLEIGAIKKSSEGIGRAPSQYKVRTKADMNTLHEREEVNPEWRAWDKDLNDQFFDIIVAEDEISGDCEECHDGDLCPQHEFKLARFKDSQPYRDMLLWISDNPKPDMKMRMVKGRRIL